MERFDDSAGPRYRGRASRNSKKEDEPCRHGGSRDIEFPGHEQVSKFHPPRGPLSMNQSQVLLPLKISYRRMEKPKMRPILRDLPKP